MPTQQTQCHSSIPEVKIRLEVVGLFSAWVCKRYTLALDKFDKVEGHWMLWETWARYKLDINEIPSIMVEPDAAFTIVEWYITDCGTMSYFVNFANGGQWWDFTLPGRPMKITADRLQTIGVRVAPKGLLEKWHIK